MATGQPIDGRGLHRRIRGMIEDAERFIAKPPSHAVAAFSTDGDKPVRPDLAILHKYRRSPGAPSGLWPSPPDIARAMLERYGKPKS